MIAACAEWAEVAQTVAVAVGVPGGIGLMAWLLGKSMP